MKDYPPAKKRASVSVGESVRILRELQEMSQNQGGRMRKLPNNAIGHSGPAALTMNGVLAGAELALCPAARLNR